MAHWDDRIGISRNAMSALPLLLLPMGVGAAALILWPGLGAGTAAIIFSTIAVAWYLLGGAISVSHVMRRIATRKALAMIQSEAAAAPEAVWVCDASGKVLFQNAPARQEFGDISDENILQLFESLRADARHELTGLTELGEASGCAEISLASGAVIVLNRAPGSSLQVWSCHRPGAQVGEDEDEPGDDFEAIPVALLRLSPDGRIRRANLAARHLLGGDVLAAEETHLGALLDGPGRSVGDWISDVSAGRIDTRAEMLRLRADDGGKERYFQVTLAPDPSERPCLIAVLSDASALKTLEAQFVQSQKMQAIGQLAGGVAHDFNNLLTAIRGHCDLLMLRHDKGDPHYADLDQISQNTNRAGALVGQLLAFSRKQTLKLQTLDLRDTLAELTHLLNRLVGERVALTITNDPAVRPIRADKRQLEQVIMNLVVNARDAMPSGGDITVRTENVCLTEGMSRDRVSLPVGEYVCISVTDDGCGIPPDMQNKIFEPFFTTKRTGEGTGLGLSTAYGIVKQTGGYIFCDSEVGRGTCFSLYFPAHDKHDVVESQAQIAPQAVPAIAPTQRATVLLVEDEAPVRAFAARALRLKGYDVHEADSAEAALELLSDSLLAVDVFVTDVVMPGMDGPSWVRTALKDRPQTRVVFMSGYTDNIFGEGHAPVPNSAFLPKPFTLQELADTVAQQLSAPAARIH